MAPDKTLDQVRNNPAGDWKIRDIERVCRIHGLMCKPPRRGSHYTIVFPKEILTIPARRPVKAVYIRRFVSMLDSIITA